MDTVLKEGFLLKRDDSFMFPGWKSKFCRLSNSTFSISRDGRHLEEKFNTQMNMKKVEQGFETESLNLPKGRSDMESMFSIHTKKKKYFFLAQNSSECLAWIGALKNSQSHQVNPVAPPMHSAPQMQAPQMHHPPPYSNAPPQYQQSPSGASASSHGYNQPAFNPNYGPRS